MGLAKKPMFVVPNHLVEQWGARIPQALSAGAAVHRRAGAFRGRQPPAGDGAHRQRQLRRRDRLAPLVRVPAGLGQAVQALRRRAARAARGRDRRGQGGKGRQPPHREGAGESQEAARRQAQATRRPRAQGQCASPSRSWASIRLFVDEADALQEPVLHHQNEPHRGPAELRQQPRLRHVHEDALHPRADRRARRGLRHRHADLEHHGRDVHDAALSGARPAGGARRRAFRRLGGELRGGRDRAGTGPRRLGLPHAHALRQIHQPAGAAVDVPHGRRRADRRHAEPAPPGVAGGKPQMVAAPAGEPSRRTSRR